MLLVQLTWSKYDLIMSTTVLHRISYGFVNKLLFSQIPPRTELPPHTANTSFIRTGGNPEYWSLTNQCYVFIWRKENYLRFPTFHKRWKICERLFKVFLSSLLTFILSLLVNFVQRPQSHLRLLSFLGSAAQFWNTVLNTFSKWFVFGSILLLSWIIKTIFLIIII